MSLIPVCQSERYIICFEALPEDESMRHHFVKICGWTQKEFNRIRNHDWFTAKVSAWLDGEELGQDYMGACCYKDAKEFYTTYKDDYFSQMMDTAIKMADTALAFRADPKGIMLQKDFGLTRDEICDRVSRHYTEKLKGHVSCNFHGNLYHIYGSGLPAHPDAQHQYPNGWSMSDSLSEAEALVIATGKEKP